MPQLLFAQQNPKKATTLFSWNQVCPKLSCKFWPFLKEILLF